MLDDAVIFAKVVECGNFSKAARDLGITPAAVSKKIMRIEKRLDASLLYRNTRGVQLTSQGQAYYRLMRQALNTSIEAEQAVRELSTSMNGLIRIAAGPSFTCHPDRKIRPRSLRLRVSSAHILISRYMSPSLPAPSPPHRKGQTSCFNGGNLKTASS